MKKPMPEVTASLEDYLEAIYFLNGENGDVRVTDLAVKLEISKPSVNRAINTLKGQGYVDHEHYGCLRLTDEGLKIARNIAGRHIMLKRFLMEIIEVPEETAESEACAIEHDFSADTMKKIEAYMKKVLK